MARDPVTRVPPRLSIAMCVFVCMNVSVCVCLYQGLGRIRSLSSLYSPIHTTTITYIVLYATYSATEHSSSPPLSLSLFFSLSLSLSSSCIIIFKRIPRPTVVLPIDYYQASPVVADVDGDDDVFSELLYASIFSFLFNQLIHA